jgi:hypothetical protein
VRADFDGDSEQGKTSAPAPAANDTAAPGPTQAGPVASEPAVGEDVQLPDVISPPSPEGAGVDHDAVHSTLGYSPSVSQEGTFDPFGDTKWYIFNFRNIHAKRVAAPAPAPGPSAPSPGPAPPAPAPGPSAPAPAAPPTTIWEVTATVENPITFNVGSPKIDITSETSAALTPTNYPTAASDLTPDMAVEGGKPPRTQFWASDLTVIHEQFHVTERKKFNQGGVNDAQAWLDKQSASSLDDVKALIDQLRPIIRTSSDKAINAPPGREERAYTAGAPAYLARANAIRAKGAAGGYAKQPAPSPPAPAPTPSPPAPRPAPGPAPGPGHP